MALYPPPISIRNYYHLLDTSYSYYLVVENEFLYIDRIGISKYDKVIRTLGWITLSFCFDRKEYLEFKQDYDRALELSKKLLGLL